MSSGMGGLAEESGTEVCVHVLTTVWVCSLLVIDRDVRQWVDALLVL